MGGGNVPLRLRQLPINGNGISRLSRLLVKQFELRFP